MSMAGWLQAAMSDAPLCEEDEQAQVTATACLPGGTLTTLAR